MSTDDDRAELESWLSFVGHDGWKRLLDELGRIQDRATREVMEGKVVDDHERSIRIGRFLVADEIIWLPAARIAELRANLNMEDE